MIQVYPNIALTEFPAETNCAAVQQLYITGTRVMSTATAPDGRAIYQELPINAGSYYPISVDAATGSRNDKYSYQNWYTSGLVDSYKNRYSKEIGFTVKKYKPFTKEKTALLHTLDSTYGHALFELFNATYYMQRPDTDLIIVVQKNLEWLVPDGAAQVWVVDLSFSKASDWNDWLAERMNQEIASLERPVFICQSFVQTDSSDFDIEQYSRIQPFDLDRWDETLHTPTLTFIWRSDRFWRKVLPRLVDNRHTRKLFNKQLNRLNARLQFRWIRKYAETLKKQIPSLDFAISGMDNRDIRLPDWIKDYREPVHNDDSAREQCRRYAKSHLVVGCNGSSLILPGCHSGGIINIVPGGHWSVSAGSFPFRIPCIGDTHFRYCLLPPEITIERLAQITLSVLRDRSYIQIQTAPPWRSHDAGLKPFDWAEMRHRTIQLSDHFSQDGLVTKTR
jgi:hypothetical protein